VGAVDNQVITTMISTGGAVIVGIAGMWISSNQLGKRIDDTHRRLDDLGRRIERLEEDNKQFFQWLGRIENRFSRIEDKLGIQPH
jgi:hypothetical protein